MTTDKILWVVTVALVFASPPTRVAHAEGKCLALYAQGPEYPLLSNGRRPEGKGLFICHIDAKTGSVTSVSVAKSTGFAILDKAAIDANGPTSRQP